jgi:signal transduction histidine kinase
MKFTRPGLTWTLYWVGLAQLVLVLGAAVLTSVFAARYWARWDLPSVIEHLEPLAERPNELQQKLQQMREAGGPELSVYDTKRGLVASNVEPPLAIPQFGLGAAPGFHPRAQPGPLESLLPGLLGEPPHGPFRHREAVARLQVLGAEGTLVMKRNRDGFGPWPLVLTLLAGFAVVGVGAALTARLVVRPLLNVEKELMANVAHELRTPLSRIRVALEIAGEGDAATARTSLEEIALDLAELEALIEDVLTATRLELAGEGKGSGGLPLSFKEASSSAVAEEAAARFRARHPERSLRVSFAPELPLVRADASLLRRALDNLLENAQKYSPDSQAPIGFSAEREGPSLRFEIRDHGLGIAPADLARVFSPFFRGERSRTRSAGGVGLGLTLAKQIIEAHSGRIELSGTPGGGTTARVTLPIS